LIRQRHIRVGRQIVNVPSFVVRLDSQKVRINYGLRRSELTYATHSTLTLRLLRRSGEGVLVVLSANAPPPLASLLAVTMRRRSRSCDSGGQH
jgi:hypothetical protein